MRRHWDDLKENGWTEIHNDSVENTYEQAVDGKFYDYAVEDEALTITEDAVLDTSFVTKSAGNCNYVVTDGSCRFSGLLLFWC